MGHERMGSSGRGGGRGAAGGGGGGMERKKYPIRAEDYELYEEIGEGVSASVYCAKCIPFNEIVAVKILDLEKNRNSDLNNLSREAQTMVLVNHPNLLNAHCSFASDKTLWVVMPYMRGGSCLNVLKSAYPDGFEEVVIATILREVLKGLEYLHTQGHIHRDIKAGNILLDASAGVKLGDFGVSASLYDSGDRQRMRNTFVGTPCWMAPEVMEQLHGYDFKADIWSFGITALELAHGHAPFSKYPPMKVFLMTMQNAPPSLNYERDRKYTKNFRHMIALCLLKDPSKRPTAHKLLKHSFFKQARSNEYIDRNLLDGLPLLADRIKALKVKEQDMLDQKKMPDGKKEQLSQNEYKRGISCWNFDIDDLKVQSSLVQDDDCVDDKYTCGSASSIFEIGSLQLNRSPSVSSASCSSRDELERDNNELMQGKTTTATISDQFSASQRMNSNGVDRGISLSSSSSRSAPPNVFDCLDNEIETELSEICGTETKYGRAKYHEKKGTCAPLDVPQRLFKEESGLPRAHSQNGEICNGALTPTANDSLSETIYKASRPSASEETDAKSKVPVVQQKGRFKVTSENIEVEKVPSLPGIPKSLSFQAIPQVSAFNLSSPVAAKPNIIGSKLFQQLQSFLQDNTNMRDHILNAMKQAVAGDFSAPANQATDGVSVQSGANTTEKSLLVQLEAANEKEKELVQQVADLQWRLLCVQEELQKLKARSS